MTDTRPFNPALFREDAIAPDTAKLNEAMVQLLTPQPEWWIVGAAAFRAARRRGEGPFPAPVMSPRARTITITGKDGNEIPLRVIAPSSPRGIYLHIHGGGWVFGGADMQDPMLDASPTPPGRPWSAWNIGWRRSILYPTGPDDCEAAAAWLVQNGKHRIRHRRVDHRRQVGGRPLVGGHRAAHARSLRLHGFPRRQSGLWRIRFISNARATTVWQYEAGAADD